MALKIFKATVEAVLGKMVKKRSNYKNWKWSRNKVCKKIEQFMADTEIPKAEIERQVQNRVIKVISLIHIINFRAF